MIYNNYTCTTLSRPILPRLCHKFCDLDLEGQVMNFSSFSVCVCVCVCVCTCVCVCLNIYSPKPFFKFQFVHVFDGHILDLGTC